MDQISFDDLIREHELSKLPGRIAFIDECGNFGFDFDSEGVSKYYILCAVIVKNSELSQLHNAVLKTSLDKGTQRKTTENELPSLTQCTA